MNEKTVLLRQVAHGRSGDKGSHANIGIIAYTDAGFEWLQSELTEERVASYFAALQPTKVERYELPGIRALNFLLRDVLDGGGSRSLRIDSQGKTLGLALLEMPLPSPHNVGEMLAINDQAKS